MANAFVNWQFYIDELEKKINPLGLTMHSCKNHPIYRTQAPT